MGSSSFNNFYRDFIRLAPYMDHTSEMFILGFLQKISPSLRVRLNDRSKLPDNIQDLRKRCLDIYEQMQATDGIRDQPKPSASSKTRSKRPATTSTTSTRAPDGTNASAVSCSTNPFPRTVTRARKLYNAERIWLIREGR